MNDLERLALAFDAAEDAVCAASGQHREDLWDAAREAQREFHDAANPQTVLALLNLWKAAKAQVAAYNTVQDRPCGEFTGDELPACERADEALRAALAAIGEQQ